LNNNFLLNIHSEGDRKINYNKVKEKIMAAFNQKLNLVIHTLVALIFKSGLLTTNKNKIIYNMKYKLKVCKTDYLIKLDLLDIKNLKN